MKLYKSHNGTLESVKINPFTLEKEIQSLVEANVLTLFELEFIASELTFENFRLDSLCFNNETNSFVIIEYKKGSSYSVIDQGFSYLSLMLNNKSDFVLEYNEILQKNIKRNEVDWSQSKVIFISPKFSEYQKKSVNFKNLPLELWEITRYSDGAIGLNKISTESDAEIHSAITSDISENVIGKVTKEIKIYDENYFFNKNKNRPEDIIELYRTFKEKIINLGSAIEIKFNAHTISFKQNKIFADLIIYNKGINIIINMKNGQLKDPLNLTEDVSEVGHWGNGDYRIKLSNDDNLEYAMSLIKQSYHNQL